MFAHQRKRVQFLFAAVDASFTWIAFCLAYWTRTQLKFDRVFFLQRHSFILLSVFSVAVWVGLGLLQRVYEYLDSASTGRIIARTLRQSLLGIVLLILFQYLLNLEHPISRSFIAVFFLYDLILLTAFRLNARHIIGAFQKGFGTAYHLVIVGSSEKTTRLVEQLCHGSPFRMEVTARLSEDDCAARLPQLLSHQVVDEVIFDVESERLSQLEDVFLKCDEQGVRTRVAIDFFPHVNSDVTLDRVGEASLLTFSAAPLDDLRLLLKRFLDIVIAGTALLVFSPFVALIAALIKLTSPGPVVYSQTRCGLNGRRFTMYKFRSMVADADRKKADLEHRNERKVVFKMSNDPRITPLGRWLRKFSIDEVPQLLNVLRGDMSIVGPRPPIPDEVARYEPWQKRRLRMRPGLTCIWAVCGRDEIDFHSWMKMDISYIENWSLKLDWSIMLRTIPHVLAGKGAH